MLSNLKDFLQTLTKYIEEDKKKIPKDEEDFYKDLKISIFVFLDGRDSLFLWIMHCLRQSHPVFLFQQSIYQLVFLSSTGT